MPTRKSTSKKPAVSPRASARGDLGQVKNHFGFLQHSSTARLNPERLRNFMLPETSSTELAKVLKIGRAGLYKSSLKLSSELVKERLMPLVIAADLAYDIFDDEKQAKEWMNAPNAYFFGQSPADVCLAGNGVAVITLLRERIGEQELKIDGAATG